MGLAKDLSLRGWRFPGREQSRLMLLPGAEMVYDAKAVCLPRLPALTKDQVT